MNSDQPNPPSALPQVTPGQRDAFAHAPFALEDVLHRLDQFESPLAVVDEGGRVVDANGPWRRRQGSELWCAVGGDLGSICGQAAQAGSAPAERLSRELAGVLQGRTEFCEWDSGAGERVRLARLVAVSGTYALAAFDAADTQAA